MLDRKDVDFFDSNSISSTSSIASTRRSEGKLRMSIDKLTTPKMLKSLTASVYSIILLMILLGAYLLFGITDFNKQFSKALELHNNFTKFETLKAELFNLDMINILCYK
jgi:hypothetical protein